MKTPTPAQLLACRFPNASKSTLAANAAPVPKPEVICDECGGATVFESGRGWWCRNQKCKMRKKKSDVQKGDAYVPACPVVAPEKRQLAFTAQFIPPTATSQQKGASAKGGKVRFFKKKAVADSERVLRAAFAPYAPSEPFTGPLRVTMTWRWPFRSSESKKNRLADKWRDTQPDYDNIAKTAGDVLSKLGFWCNDGQIADGRVIKLWSEKPGITVEIEQLL